MKTLEEPPPLKDMEWERVLDGRWRWGPYTIEYTYGGKNGREDRFLCSFEANDFEGPLLESLGKAQSTAQGHRDAFYRWCWAQRETT